MFKVVKEGGIEGRWEGGQRGERKLENGKIMGKGKIMGEGKIRGKGN